MSIDKIAAVGAAIGEPLPQQISPDGREIWDWAARFGDALHRLDRIRELRAEIKRFQCGDCQYWMCSRSCPREANDSLSGRSAGPSMNGHICPKFAEKEWCAQLRDERREALRKLLSAKGDAHV